VLDPVAVVDVISVVAGPVLPPVGGVASLSLASPVGPAVVGVAVPSPVPLELPGVVAVAVPVPALSESPRPPSSPQPTTSAAAIAPR
jgi:hypothetical protein